MCRDAARVCNVPDAVRTFDDLPPVNVVSQKMADGVWFLGGGTHNSDADRVQGLRRGSRGSAGRGPLQGRDRRSEEAGAEQAHQVRLINTHHHFDHSGGLRTYVAEGATIITNEGKQVVLRNGLECAAHAAAGQAVAESEEGHVHHLQGQIRTDGRKPRSRNLSHAGRQPQRIHVASAICRRRRF